MGPLTWKRLFWLAIVILFFPLDWMKRLPRIHLPTSRYDERDTMFARLARKPGTPHYEDYYSRRPELKRADDRVRSITRLTKPGSKHFRPDLTLPIQTLFKRIPQIVIDRSRVKLLANRVRQAQNQPAELSVIAKELGAIAVGFSTAPVSLVYSVRGRHDSIYGQEITDPLPYALVFLVEMDHDHMRQAPKMIVLKESARQYYNAALIAKILAAVFQELGHKASAQFDAHYDVILPPLAVLAGLGELGRNNILIADKYGSRVRIAAVLTDTPLPQSQMIDLGVEHFCSICKKCATTCPSHSLSKAEKTDVRGTQIWTTREEKCVAYWRTMGSDCGICMAVCPYSHKTNPLHHTVRFLIRLNPWMRHMANWADDLIYGKTWKIKS
jgi:reductive dehalogenase